VPLAFPDGSRLLVLPESGRLLGLFTPETDENVLWTNPALATAESATAYFNRAGWPNPGGDRTWLAPEIELFLGDLKRPWETYKVQPALDPGHWTLETVTDAELCLTNSTRVRLHRSGRDIDVRLRKSYRAAANPLSKSGLHYAGYTQVTTVELDQAAEALRQGSGQAGGPPVGLRAEPALGIWNLLQLPQPGTMLIPTRTATGPQLVFGKCVAGELAAEAGLVRWHMAAPGPDAKIAIKAPSLTGRAGYLRQTATSGIWDLVIREFAVDPGGNYVDALWEPPHETGWCFQACCVRNGDERFNELEYHAPAAIAAAGANTGRDESRVWAFRGAADAVSEAACVLLGVDIERIVE